MPLRGSVQLLLLFLRGRATRLAGLGIAAIALAVAGGVSLEHAFPSLGKDSFAQALRQGAWEQALAGQTKAARWPWEDLSVNMSLMPAGTVPRLGLSAAMRTQARLAPESHSPAAKTPRPIPPVARGTPQGDVALGDVALGDVALGGVMVGDKITFTAADGATCVYRISGRRVVDPHLAASEAERFDGESAAFECGPLENLILQATQGQQDEPLETAAPVISEQRKL